MPPVSVRAFAKLDGCSHTLVQRAIKEGRLSTDENGKIDPALAGTGWRKENRRAGNVATGGNTKVAKVATSPKKPPTAEEVEGATEELFAEEAEDFLNKVLAGDFADIATAERIKENGLAAKHLLAARRDAGHLVEIEVAETVLFETQRSQRDAWMNFPTRVGPLLAAELGLDADKVVEALTVHVHQQLDDLGEPEADFSGKREG